MGFHNPEHEFSPKPSENETFSFADKFRDLLPGVEFEEPGDMRDARAAVLEALTMNEGNPDLLQSIWEEYADVCQQTIDNRTDTDPQIRAQLQIAGAVHKALIFREAGDMQRYGRDLSDAEEYAYDMYFDKIAEAIGAELDNFAT